MIALFYGVDLERLLQRHPLPQRRQQVADPARAAPVRPARQRARQRREPRPEPGAAARPDGPDGGGGAGDGADPDRLPLPAEVLL